MARRDLHHRTAIELTDMQACYFAALIEGLRVIDRKESERARHSLSARPLRTSANDRYSAALQVFVQEKGKRIAVACGIL